MTDAFHIHCAACGRHVGCYKAVEVEVVTLFKGEALWDDTMEHVCPECQDDLIQQLDAFLKTWRREREVERLAAPVHPLEVAA